MTPHGRLSRDAWGRWRWLDAAGQTHDDVEVCAPFPWSARGRELLIRDATGRELQRFATWDGCPAELRADLEAALAERDFVPEIQAIRAATHPYPPCRWQVETDRGPATVSIESEEDVRSLSNGAILIADGTGLRFLIRDVEGLDTGSRRHLRRLL